MMNFCNPTLRLLPAAALLALGPALFADDSLVTFTNGTRMNLTLKMDPRAEEGLEVCASVDADPWTFTGGCQGITSLELAPGTRTTFFLAPGRSEGAMAFQVRPPAGSRVAGNGSTFGLVFRTHLLNREQRATLTTDLNDQELELGGTYIFFSAVPDGARGLHITQTDVVEPPEAEDYFEPVGREPALSPLRPSPPPTGPEPPVFEVLPGPLPPAQAGPAAEAAPSPATAQWLESVEDIKPVEIDF